MAAPFPSRQIKDTATERTSSEFLGTDWLIGQVAAGGSRSTFKARMSQLVAYLMAAIEMDTAGTVNVVNYGAIGSTDGSSESVDTAAFAAAAVACTTRGMRIIVPPLTGGKSYYLSANYLDSLTTGRGCVTELAARVFTKVPLVVPREHVIRGPNVSEKNADRSAIIAAHSAHTGGILVRLGPNTADFAHGARLENLDIDGNDVVGIAGVYGDRLQEGSGCRGVRVQGCRKAGFFPYAATAGTGRNANFQLLDNEWYTSAPTATTVAVNAVATASTVTFTAVTGLSVGDYVGINANGGAGYHYAVVTGISGSDVTFEPALVNNSDAGNAIKHASAALDIWSGVGTVVQRNTAIVYASTLPLAPGVRCAGNGYTVRSLHGESEAATLELGGYIINGGAGVLASDALIIEGISGNAGAVGSMDVVRIANRDLSAYSQQHRLRSVVISGVSNVGSCVNLLNDAGSGTGGAGREAAVLDVATYGNTMAAPYGIGAAYPSANYGPRTFMGALEGRRNITLAAGNTDNLDVTYARFLRLTPDAANSTIRSIAGYRFGRELWVVNVGAGPTITLTHASAATPAEARFICNTGADIVLAAGEVAVLTYGIGTTAARWYARKL